MNGIKGKINLKELAEKQKVSYWNIACNTKIRYQTIRNYRDNKIESVKLWHIVELCNYLNCSVSELIK